MARFRDIKTLQKFASVHASIHNHWSVLNNPDRGSVHDGYYDNWV